MELIIIIVLLIVAAIVGFISYKLGKNSVETQVRIDNSKLESEKESLEKEILLRKQHLSSIQNQYIEKKELIDSAEQRAEKEYQQWQRIFEDKKIKNLQEAEELKAEIMAEAEQENAKLLSLQRQKAATIEAFRREQEVQEKSELYRIPFDEDEIHDIDYLNQIRPKMRFPQVIGKVIWSSFIQKKMNNFVTNLLGKDKVCGIYKITDNITQESYIGQSVSVAERFKEHVKCGVGATPTSSSNLLYAAMRRDGIENFSFELLESCEREELDKKEKYYIGLYQTDICGLNITKGNS